jgi:hypothetical protein
LPYVKIYCLMAGPDKKTQFWKSFLHAVETEPRDVSVLIGSSGLSHPVVALGVDDKRRRVVIISGEPDARVAAMAHGDIQASMPSIKVIMARPAAVNLGAVAQLLAQLIGKTSIGQEQINWLAEHKEDMQKFASEHADGIIDRIGNAISGPYMIASLNILATVKEMIQQLALVEIETKPSQRQDELEGPTVMPTLHLSRLMALDPVEVDRRMGVCSVPLYDFSPAEVEIMHSGTRIDEVRNSLKERHIFQYFFPAPDHLVLGLAEEQSLKPVDIVDRLSRVPKIGHPYGEMEIVDRKIKITEIINALQERGLLIEGELGVEISESGEKLRSVVRFKPREGLLARISRLISIKIDLSLKDILK